VQESGKVIRRLGGKIVEVQLQATPSCGKCGLCNMRQPGVMTMDAVDGIGVRVGDQVEIEVAEANVILSSFLIFICPLITFFAGFIIRGAILGTVMVLIYLIFLYFYDKKTGTTARITRVLS